LGHLQVREDRPDHGRIVQRADQAQPAPAIGFDARQKVTTYAWQE
jgi:hypothetical protein